MNRLLSLAVLIAMLVSASACGGKKPPEQALAKSKNVLSTLRELNRSYDAKNLDAFMADVSDAYTGRDAFSRELGSVFKRSASVRLSIHYNKMVIMMDQTGKLKPTFTWDAEWVGADGASQKDGGRVTLVFESGSFKLLSVDGKNPFLPQPAEPRGNKK